MSASASTTWASSPSTPRRRSSAASCSRSWRAGKRCSPTRSPELHVAAVLAADFEQGVGDLPERADPYRIHQHGEDVLIANHCLAQPFKHVRRLLRISRLKIAQAFQLRLLFLFGRTDQLEFLRRRVGVRVAEAVDADDRVGAVVLPVLVVERLFLDLAALVAGLHGAEHAAAAGDRLELLQHRLLDEIGELLEQERALVRDLVLRHPPFSFDDLLYRTVTQLSIH